MTTPSCWVCNSPRVRRDPFYYDWNGRHWQIWRCTVCTHQFVHPPLSSEDLDLVYGDRYFSRSGDWACGCYNSGYNEAQPELRIESREILDMIPLRRGKLLDVGCAGGVFLDEARQRGFEPFGIELNRTMADRARSELGLNVIHSSIHDVDDDRFDGLLDVVTFLDSLEHIPHANSAVRKIARWIKPGGYLLVRGPLVNDWRVRLKETLRRVSRLEKKLDGYPLDVNYFNRRSLSALLEGCGFRIESWIRANRVFANALARRKA